MIDHASLHVSDHARSKQFYITVLKPLGYVPLSQSEMYTGFGAKGWSDVWISQSEDEPAKTHLAFFAPTKQLVHMTYETAIKAGAKDNGPPGPRPDYSPTYYAAYFLDPDGHNIEVVNHEEE